MAQKWADLWFSSKVSLIGPLALAAIAAALDMAFGSWADVFLTWVIAAAAAALGWLVAIVLTPFTDEDARFSRYTSALGIFVSGYVASKLDKPIDAMLSSGIAIGDVAAVRVSTAVVFFLSGLVLAYAVRRLSR